MRRSDVRRCNRRRGHVNRHASARAALRAACTGTNWGGPRGGEVETHHKEVQHAETLYLPTPAQRENLGAQTSTESQTALLQKGRGAYSIFFVCLFIGVLGRVNSEVILRPFIQYSLDPWLVFRRGLYWSAPGVVNSAT